MSPVALEAATGGIKGPHVPKIPCMYDSLNMIKCYELYNVGNAVVPFEKEIMLVGVDKGLVGIRATFDDGDMPRMQQRSLKPEI